MELRTVGIRVSLILLPALESLSSYWVVLPSLDIRALALFYYLLFCSAWLLSLGVLLFSEEKQRGYGS